MLVTKNFQKFASTVEVKNRHHSFKFINFKKFASNPQIANEVGQGVRDAYDKSFTDNNQWTDVKLDMNRGMMARLRRGGAYVRGAVVGGAKKIWNKKTKNFVKGIHESGMQEAGNYTKAVVDSDLTSLDQVSADLSNRAGKEAVQAQEIAQSYLKQGQPVPKEVKDHMAKARAFDAAAGNVMKSTSRTAQDLENNIRKETDRYQSDVEDDMYNSRNTQARISQTLEDKAYNDFRNLSGWEKAKVVLQKFLTGMGVKVPKDWAYNTFMQRQRNEARDYIMNKSNIGNQMLGEYAANTQYDLSDLRQRALFWQLNSEQMDKLNERYKNTKVNPEVQAYIAQQQEAKRRQLNSNPNTHIS